MNLTILYWLATDYGISVGSRMSGDFFAFSAGRLAATAGRGARAFRRTRCIEWIEYGKSLEVADAGSGWRASLSSRIRCYMAS